jgi:hypothetical protein
LLRVESEFEADDLFELRGRRRLRGLRMSQSCVNCLLRQVSVQIGSKGRTLLGTAQLSGGKATLTISTLAVGSTKVTVTYNGDSNIAKSSASVVQTVH